MFGSVVAIRITAGTPGIWYHNGTVAGQILPVKWLA
jgi:hypothetical protein